MPTRFDSLALAVSVAGQDISSSVVSCRIRYGFDIKCGEVEITLGQLPSSPINQWDTLSVEAGLVSAGGDTAGQRPRFNGYVFDFSADLWPWAPKIVGRGPLIIADKVQPLTDAWAQRFNPADTPDPLAVPSKYEPPGIDMTLNGVGQTDGAMVLSVLQQIGLGGWIADVGQIGGTARVLGTQAVEQFVWRRGQSALSFIEELERVTLGFCTFERVGGQIWRAKSGPFAPFSGTVATLNEGRDLLEGASLSKSVKDVKNAVECQGWDDGGGPAIAYVHVGVPTLPPGVAIQMDTIQSNYVEKFYMTDIGDGLAADEVAAWWLGESRYVMLQATVPTWRDDVLSPGDVVYLNAPHLLSVNQSMWLQHLEIEITNEPSWTQTLTLRAADFTQTGGVGTLPGSLPGSLG